MTQKQKRRVTATFEGKTAELDADSLVESIGSTAKDWGLESFEVTASSGEQKPFERVSPDKLEDLASGIEQVRLYRVERAG